MIYLIAIALNGCRAVCLCFRVHDCEECVGLEQNLVFGLEQNLVFVFVLAEMLDIAAREALDAEKRMPLPGFTPQIQLREVESGIHREGAGSER